MSQFSVKIKINRERSMILTSYKSTVNNTGPFGGHLFFNVQWQLFPMATISRIFRTLAGNVIPI